MACNLFFLPPYESVFLSCIIHPTSCQGFFLFLYCSLTFPHSYPTCCFCSTVSQTSYFQKGFSGCSPVPLLLGECLKVMLPLCCRSLINNREGRGGEVCLGLMPFSSKSTVGGFRTKIYIQMLTICQKANQLII